MSLAQADNNTTLPPSKTLSLYKTLRDMLLKGTLSQKEFNTFAIQRIGNGLDFVINSRSSLEYLLFRHLFLAYSDRSKSRNSFLDYVCTKFKNKNAERACQLVVGVEKFVAENFESTIPPIIADDFAETGEGDEDSKQKIEILNLFCVAVEKCRTELDLNLARKKAETNDKKGLLQSMKDLTIREIDEWKQLKSENSLCFQTIFDKADGKKVISLLEGVFFFKRLVR